MSVRTIVSATALLGLVAGHAMAQTNPPGTTGTTTVVVNARTPPVVHKADRTVYNLQDNTFAVTGSVSDVLSTLPSVYVDPRGGVTVHGATAQIYVDGKPAPAFRGNLAVALQAMPANTVAEIEVITNPGPEFRSDAHTIINLVTKKPHGQSPAGELTVNVGADAKYDQTLLGSFGVGKWTFNGSIGLRQDRNTYTEGQNRVSLDASGNPASQLVENEAASKHLDSTTLDGTTTYSATSNDSVSLAIDATSRLGERRMNDAFAISSPVTAAAAETDTTSYGPYHSGTLSLTGTYKHTDPTGGNFTLRGMHEEDDSFQDYRYDQVDLTPVAPNVLDRSADFQRALTDNLTGDYVRTPGTDTEFKSGFDVESARIQFYNLGSTIDAATGTETLDPAFTQRFLADDRMAAAYASYQAPLGKWLILGGLRVENMLTRLTDARADGYSQISDTFWSPSLFLSRNLTTDSKIRFSYSRHITRPQNQSLDPTPVFEDPNDVYQGNPNLKPSSEDSYEANYNLTTKPFSLDATAYYRDTANAFTDYAYAQTPKSNVLVWSTENAGRSQRSGLDFSLGFHPSKAVEINLSTDLYGSSMDAPYDGLNIHQAIGSYLTKAALTWQGTSEDNVQLNYQVWGPQLIAEGTQSGAQWLGVTYEHKLGAKLKVTASVFDVLDSVKYHETQRPPQFQDVASYFYPRRSAYIGLDYKFGAGK